MNRISSARAAALPARRLGPEIKKYKGFYLLFLPVLVFTIVFHYLPMFGLWYAFTDYKGVRAPKFVGLENFEKMFAAPGFWTAFWNTLYLSIGKLLLTTFLAVLISLLLNEITCMPFKKTAQTIIYLPHFMSWVVAASIFALILSPSREGLVNSFLVKAGILPAGSEIYFLGNKSWWTPVYFLVNVWKETGWQTIIFLATLSNISPELYEAATMDGANRWDKMRYVTVPALANTIITVLILNLAKVMNLFESVFVMQNDAVVQQSDVLQTYIYTQTFNSGALPNYGYTTAVGIVKSLVGCFLVLVCNYASKKVRGRGII